MEVLTEYSLTSKVIAIVADNAANCLKVAGYLSKKTNSLLLIQFSCACHIINLIVKKLVENTMEEAVEKENDENFQFSSQNEAKIVIKKFVGLIEKCRNITRVFHQSSQLNELLREKQNELEIPLNCLIQEVPTRWNSMLLMVLRIYEQAYVNFALI